MMDFSGSNRGYFFVCYTCREDAMRAVKELNNYEIRPNRPVGVILSVDNRKLWLSGIPKNRTASEIKASYTTYKWLIMSVYRRVKLYINQCTYSLYTCNA